MFLKLCPVIRRSLKSEMIVDIEQWPEKNILEEKPTVKFWLQTPKLGGGVSDFRRLF